MLGAIVGDIIGSRFEFKNTNSIDFELFTEKNKFTDDTVLTCATAEKLLLNTNYVEAYRRYGKIYESGGFGSRFRNWLSNSNPEPYNSYGNGSAMRVGPVGWAFDTKIDVLNEAKCSAEVTHNHPDGVRGAQAVSLAIFLARKKKTKKDIIEEVERLGYNLDLSPKNVVRKFDVSCQGTIPVCFSAFNNTDNFEDAIRMVISFGGDSDTNSAIVGSIAEAYYGSIPQIMVDESMRRLTFLLRNIVICFYKRYNEEKYHQYFDDSIHSLLL